MRLNAVDLDTDDADSRLIKSSDLDDSETTSQFRYTIDPSKSQYDRAMIIDGISGNVGLGTHFKRSLKPLWETSLPQYKLDVQGSIRIVAQLEDGGNNTLASGGAVDQSGTTAGDYGVEPDPSLNYGFQDYESSMGEIIIQRETPQIHSGTLGTGTNRVYRHKDWNAGKSQDNNNLVSYDPSGNGGYLYDYPTVIKISPYADSFISNGYNFGLGTDTPHEDARLHIVNSEPFHDGDANLMVKFTDVDSVWSSSDQTAPVSYTHLTLPTSDLE